MPEKKFNPTVKPGNYRLEQAPAPATRLKMTQILYAFAKVRVSLSLRPPLRRAAGAVEVRSIKIFTS